MALGELLRRAEQLLAPRARLEHVHRGEDAPVRDRAIEDQLHVPGALELLEDHLVHAAPGVDEGGGEDRQAAAALAVARGAEELPRELQGPVVDAAAHGASPGTHLPVAGTAEAGGAVAPAHPTPAPPPPPPGPP